MEAVRKKKYMRMGILLLTVLLASCPVPPPGEGRSLIDSVVYRDYNEKSTDWTVLYYVDGDNNLESYLLQDIYELSKGMESTDIVNVIALFDRAPDYSADSTILGANFTDTRLYRVGADEIYPLDGEEFFDDIGLAETAEYNMGDVQTLKSFIEYGKKYYPANHYALIFSNHGGGVKGASDDSSIKSGSGIAGDVSEVLDKAICYDFSSDDDCIYTAEMSNVLDSRHSVDLLVYDACVMGLLELAYQYRPDTAGGDPSGFSADYMVASAPNVWGYGLPYDRIFSRISKKETGNAGHTSQVQGDIDADGTIDSDDIYDVLYVDPSTMTGKDFGLIMVEEQDYDTQVLNPSSTNQSFSLYDLDYSDEVVTAFDALAAGDLKSSYNATTLQTDLRSDIGSDLTYSNDVGTPHFDLYALADYRSDGTLKTAVDNMVVASFGEFSGFTDKGKHGLGFFFPNNNTYTSSITGESKKAWYWQYWYTGESFGSSIEYGQLAFCQDRTGFSSGNVDSWFELLQFFYNPETNNTTDYSNYHPGFY